MPAVPNWVDSPTWPLCGSAPPGLYGSVLSIGCVGTSASVTCTGGCPHEPRDPSLFSNSGICARFEFSPYTEKFSLGEEVIKDTQIPEFLKSRLSRGLHGRVSPWPTPTTAPHGLHARAPPWRARCAPWMARIGQYPRGARGVPPLDTHGPAAHVARIGLWMARIGQCPRGAHGVPP